METFITNNFKTIIVIFLLWAGFCLYQFSQTGRYRSSEHPVVVDSHSGDYYVGGELVYERE